MARGLPPASARSARRRRTTHDAGCSGRCDRAAAYRPGRHRRGAGRGRAAASERGPIASVRRQRRNGGTAKRGLRRGQRHRRTQVSLRPTRRDIARRTQDREPQDSWGDIGRDAVLRARAGTGTGSRGHSRSRDVCGSRHAASQGAAPGRSSPRGGRWAEPARSPLPQGDRPRALGVVQHTLSAAGDPAHPGGGHSAFTTWWRDGTSRQRHDHHRGCGVVPTIPRRDDPRSASRSVARMAQAAARDGWRPLDQQCRGRHQLGHARGESADACVRRREAALGSAHRTAGDHRRTARDAGRHRTDAHRRDGSDRRSRGRHRRRGCDGRSQHRGE